MLNPFSTSVPLLYFLKTSENRRWVQKWNIGRKWVKIYQKHLFWGIKQKNLDTYIFPCFAYLCKIWYFSSKKTVGKLKSHLPENLSFQNLLKKQKLLYILVYTLDCNVLGFANAKVSNSHKLLFLNNLPQLFYPPLPFQRKIPQPTPFFSE